MKFAVFFISLLFSGCVVVLDKTNDPIAGSFVNSYFTLSKDGYLYEGRCADIDATIQSTEWCIGVQAFNSGNEISKTPKNYKTYLESKDKWDRKLFTKLAFEEQRTIIAPLPKGTIFKITRLVSYPWGSNGYYWAIRGVIVQGKHAVQEVEFPTNSALVFPRWLVDYGTIKLPEFSSEFLVKCNYEECT